MMGTFITIVLVLCFIAFVVYKTVFAKKLGGDNLSDKPKPPVDSPRK